MKTLFINIPDAGKRAGVENICRKIGADIRRLGSEDADRTLISIVSGGKYDLGLQAPEKKDNSIFGAVKSGAADLPEFIIFQGFDDDSLQEYLKAYRETGLEKIPLKAVLTPYNMSWTLKELIEQLKEESRSGR